MEPKMTLYEALAELEYLSLEVRKLKSLCTLISEGMPNGDNVLDHDDVAAVFMSFEDSLRDIEENMRTYTAAAIHAYSETRDNAEKLSICS